MQGEWDRRDGWRCVWSRFRFGRAAPLRKTRTRYTAFIKGGGSMMHRRSFLFTLGAGCALADQLFWTVDTTSGKVQGIGTTGIKEFKGIPYGAPTGGKNRYLPSQKPAAWPGVRECIPYGPISPQTISSP